MNFFRRSVAALTGLLLLQLTLLGSGTACTMRHGFARPAAAADAPSGMAQTISHEIVTSNDASAPMVPMGCTGAAGRDDCRLPFAPRQCSSMMTCDVSAASAAAIDALVQVRTPALALPLPAAMHAGPSFTPDLPPPRA